MGQRPIAVRVKADAAAGVSSYDRADNTIVSVQEAARLLGVSERTVFRLLKTGVLERVDVLSAPAVVMFDVRHVPDIKHDRSEAKGRTTLYGTQGIVSDVSHETDSDTQVRVEVLTQQIEQKDAQIARMLLAHQELTRTNRRLHEQMYELAHLVLSHNMAAAQARAEAELKAQEQANSRRGLSSLLGARKRA